MVNKKMLELFCGTKSMSNIFKQNDYEVQTLDFDKQFNPTYCIDILNFNISMLNGFKPDVIHASPDCTCFSQAACSIHFEEYMYNGWAYNGWAEKDYLNFPKSDKAKNAINVLEKTLSIIEELNPKYCTIENPVCITRKLPSIKNFMKRNNYIRHTVSYCKYGAMYMKPTDIWTNNLNWIPRPVCKPKRKGSINNCHHEKAPRGSKTGIQGLKNNIERGKIPKELCIEIMRSCKF